MQRAIERTFIFGFMAIGIALLVASLAWGDASASEMDPTIEVYAHGMPNQGWAPLTVHLSAYGSEDPDGSLVRYEWDLDGNGSFETDATGDAGYVATTYTKPGEYNVRLRVSDDEGNRAVATTSILVRHPAASRVDYWSVFDDETVGRIEIVLTQAEWDRMWARPESKTEVQAAADIFGTRLESIGLSMKGNGSLSDSGAKKSWKLDINAYVERQDYENLSMILLHNNFADASMLREKLAYDMLRFAGANAAFTRFVEVWIDIADDATPSNYWGVYTMVERPDKTYLANRFGGANNSGNLYKAYAWFEQGAADLAYQGPSITDYPLPRGRFAYGAKPTGAGVDYSDIINLAWVIDGTDYATPDDFAAAVEQVLNVDSYLRYLAATFLHLNLDTYPYTGNNYYIYHNPGTDLFEWVAWDENNSWGHFFGASAEFPIYGSEESVGPLEYAPLFVKAFEVPRYRVMYEAYLDLLVRHWFNSEDFGTLVEHYRTLLAPYLTQAGGDKMYTGPTAWFGVEDFHNDLDALVSLTTDRSRFVAGQLQEGSP